MKTFGVLGAAFGFAQLNFEKVRDFIPQRYQGIVLMILGAIVAVLASLCRRPDDSAAIR